MTILITGASGFIGRHVAEDRSTEAAERISTCVETWERLNR